MTQERTGHVAGGPTHGHRCAEHYYYYYYWHFWYTTGTRLALQQQLVLWPEHVQAAAATMHNSPLHLPYAHAVRAASPCPALLTPWRRCARFNVQTASLGSAAPAPTCTPRVLTMLRPLQRERPAPTCNAQTLITVLGCCALFNSTPGSAVLDALIHNLGARLGGCNAADLSSSLGALSRLRYLPVRPPCLCCTLLCSLSS